MRIKKLFKKLKDWCNTNQGLLTLFGLIVAICALIPFNKIDFHSAGSFIDKIVSGLTYELKIPLYLFIAIFIISVIYFFRIKKRYTKINLSLKALKGTWRNEWGENGEHEIFTLNEIGNYSINGEHIFDIQEFNFNSRSNKITFYKTAIRPGDQRRVLNTLKVINNDFFEGIEQDYKIKYNKISG